jgi:arylsulfatase A-like enzyme
MYFTIFKTLFIFLIVLSTQAQKNELQNFPNVIFVLADDMGYGDVSAYNPQSKIKTPNLDQMAHDGMVFTDAHTSSSVCTPTRYGILTGRYNWRSTLKSGVLTGKSKALIPNDRTTVASILKKSGYQTAFIGKWHLGWDWAVKDSIDNSGEGWNKEDFDILDFTKPISNGPNGLGFDYAYGHSGSLDMAPYVYVENGSVTAQPDTTTVNKGKYSWWREGPTGSDFVHEEVTPNFFNRAIKYIDKAGESEKPFFLYLALPSPHTPILPTEEWQGKSGLNPYGDFVMMIDQYMGELNKELRSRNLDKNTLIIFTTDNGCSPAADIKELEKLGHYPSYIFRGHKADIFEGGHRVPFIVKWPKKIQKGSKSDQIICTTDLMATLADITNYKLMEDEGEDSYSMLPILVGDLNAEVLRPSLVNHSINGSFAIRKGDWKLIMTPDSGGWSFPNPQKDQEKIAALPPFQLYNLKKDPGELNNVYEQNDPKVMELTPILVDYIKKGRSTPGPDQDNDHIDFEWKQIRFTIDQL